MTHKKDCSIIDEYIPDINRIARCFAEDSKERLREEHGGRRLRNYEDIDPVEEPCVELAEDLDMKFAGSGVARSVFTAVPNPEAPEVEPQVTEFAECVVKFARLGGKLSKRPGISGKQQNRDEISTWESLTESQRQGTKGSAPLFAPLKDYDDQGLWVTQPYAPPPGNVGEVMSELRAVGLKPKDVYTDNVGSYLDHGESALIDYGVEMPERSTRSEVTELEDGLEDRGMWDVARATSDMQNGGVIEFWVPEDMAGERQPPERSFVRTEAFGDVTRARLYLPGFPDTMFTADVLRNELDNALEPTLNGVVYDIRVSVEDDENDLAKKAWVYPDVEIEVPRGDELPVDLFFEELDNLLDQYGRRFDNTVSGYGGSVSQKSWASEGVEHIIDDGDFDDVQGQWRNALEQIEMRNIAFESRNEPEITFLPPLKNNPAPSPRSSDLWWHGPARVSAITYRAASALLDTETRREADSLVRIVSGAVHDKYPSAIVTADVRWIDEHDSDRDVYDIQYDVRSNNHSLEPWKAIAILDDLTIEHNDEFRNI